MFKDSCIHGTGNNNGFHMACKWEFTLFGNIIARACKSDNIFMGGHLISTYTRLDVINI